MNRTEPTKAENEAAIAELKREMRVEMPVKFKDARCGLVPYELGTYAYRVVAAIEGQLVTVADFPFDNFDGNKRREAARIMAEELAERINNA